MPGRPGASTPRRTPRLSRRPLKVNATVPSACSAASPMDRARDVAAGHARHVGAAVEVVDDERVDGAAMDPRDEPARELDVADLALRHRHTGLRARRRTRSTESGRALSAGTRSSPRRRRSGRRRRPPRQGCCAARGTARRRARGIEPESAATGPRNGPPTAASVTVVVMESTPDCVTVPVYMSAAKARGRRRERGGMRSEVALGPPGRGGPDPVGEQRLAAGRADDHPHGAVVAPPRPTPRGRRRAPARPRACGAPPCPLPPARRGPA